MCALFLCEAKRGEGMSKLATRGGGEIARPLRVLVPLIKDELAAGDAAGLEHYRRAGEMLLEAKEQIPYGEWGAWVKRNFVLSASTAQSYMRLAIKPKKHTMVGTLREIANYGKPGDGGGPTWQKPVQEIITTRLNLDRLAEDRQSREKEQKLIRNLGFQLIDIGYKVLASKLHPDRGGSQEAMARLNRVRNLLRSAI
jgi:hypothetical protein